MAVFADLLDDEEYRERLQAKARSRMDEIDTLPKEIRELVHEYNWTIVKAFLDCGVKEARRIKHLIDTVRRGSDAYSVRRQTHSGLNSPISARLAAELSAHRELVVVRKEPNEAMIRASMDAVPPYVPGSGTALLSKRQKHLTRLRAALEVEGAAI